nr:truncated nef protein [Human immunodeficiency virus 1]
MKSKWSKSSIVR